MENINLVPVEPIVHHKFKVLSLDKNKLALCELDLRGGIIEILNNIHFSENADFSYKDRVFSPDKKIMYLFEFETNKRDINFFQLDIATFNLNQVTTLKLEKFFSLEKSSNINYLMDLVYLDEKNFLFFISALPREYGTPYFKYAFLIDSTTGDLVEINSNLLDGDDLLRFDSAKNFYWNNENFILLKTGRIMPYEKQEMFSTVDKNNPYYDHLESLSLISVNKLIERKSIFSAIPIEIIDYKQCMDNFRIDSENISYILKDIENCKESLINYNLKLNKKEAVRDPLEIQNYTEKEIIDPWYYSLILQLPKTPNTTSFVLDDEEYCFSLNLQGI